MVYLYLIIGYLFSVALSYYLFVNIKYLEMDSIRNWSKYLMTMDTILIIVCFIPILNILISLGVSFAQWTIDILCE